MTDQELRELIALDSTEEIFREQKPSGDPRHRVEYKLKDGRYLQVAYDSAMGNYDILGHAIIERETDSWALNEYGY